MTNSEAVEILRNGFSFSHNRGFINASNAVVRAISALEENTKLKAEIERLKTELEQQQRRDLNYEDSVILIANTIKAIKGEVQNGN